MTQYKNRSKTPKTAERKWAKNKKKPDISTNIGGVDLETCIFNTSGPADVTLSELEIIARSKSSAITMKSCTLEPSEVNPEPRYADLEFGFSP